MKKVTNFISDDWPWRIRAITILIIAGLVTGTVYLLLSLNVLPLTGVNSIRSLIGIDTIPSFSLKSDVDTSESTLDVPDDAGVLVERILPGSPAEAIDLKAGDVILTVDGRLLNETNELTEIMTAYSPGQTVTLRVQRPGEAVRELTVTLLEHYRDKEKAFLGVQFQTLTPGEVTENPGDYPVRVIRLASRVITQAELAQLAPFDVLWPQDLPEGYELSTIMEMSESAHESSGSDTFVFEYVNINDRDKPPVEQGRLLISQYTNATQSLPDLSGKTSVDRLTLDDGLEIPVFASEEGTLLNAYFEQAGVNVELAFHNMPVEEVERIVSSLAPG